MYGVYIFKKWKKRIRSIKQSQVEYYSIISFKDPFDFMRLITSSLKYRKICLKGSINAIKHSVRIHPIKLHAKFQVNWLKNNLWGGTSTWCNPFCSLYFNPHGLIFNQLTRNLENIGISWKYRNKNCKSFLFLYFQLND